MVLACNYLVNDGGSLSLSEKDENQRNRLRVNEKGSKPVSFCLLTPSNPVVEWNYDYIGGDIWKSLKMLP